MVALAWAVFLIWLVFGCWTAINLLSLERLPLIDPQGPPEIWPRVTIVIPARNEEEAIGATLDAALLQDYPHLAIAVVDDCSTDGTPREILERSGDTRLRLVTGSPPPPGWLGKPHALHLGACATEGDWILFMDADVRLERTALRHAVGYAEGAQCDHVALFPFFERKGFWEEVLMPVLAQVFVIYLPSFVVLSRRYRRLALGAGAFNLVRRSAYQSIGGHQLIKNSVVDDIRLATELKRAGFRSAMKIGVHLIRIRMYHGLGEFVAGFTKNMHAVVRAPAGAKWMLVALTLGQVFIIHLAPFLWPLWLAAHSAGALSTGLPLALGLALLVVSRVAVHRRFHYPLWPILFHPLQGIILAATQIRSLLMAYGDGVVRWRGREYRREGTSF
jgi:hypothetical protein